METIESLIFKDPRRLAMLKMVASLQQEDCYIAAGFVRNLVWDFLHQDPIHSPSALNDVDVIFFDAQDKNNCRAEILQRELMLLDASIPWQVKNQAHMHLKNNDSPYKSCRDAMSFWPEKETAVAVRLNLQGNIEVLSPFGIDSLFNGLVSHNPKRDKSIFLKRVKKKDWLNTWPKLKLMV